MTRWKDARAFIEKNGLVFVAIAIILFYWTLDILIEGRIVTRLLLTVSLLAYGISTQYLINAQLAAKDLLRRSGEQHRLMIEKLPIATFVNIKGKIVYVNPAFLMLFKLTSTDEIIGKHVLEFVPPELYDEIDKANRMMTETEVALPPSEVNIRRKDGAVITVVATPMPINFDGQTAILSVLFEITERKSKEIELEKAYKLLEIHSREVEDLQARLKEQVIRDPLTGLFNRRYLEDTLEREVARASRAGFPIGMVMIDIDHFKQVNDTHGHKAGDLILQALGKFLLDRIRAGDIACRYGGEEFILLLPQASKEITVERAEQLRTGFEALRTVYGEKALQATISLGVAVYPTNGVTADAIIHAADQAMYLAKTLGRNRVGLA